MLLSSSILGQVSICEFSPSGTTGLRETGTWGETGAGAGVAAGAGAAGGRGVGAGAVAAAAVGGAGARRGGAEAGAGTQSRAVTRGAGAGARGAGAGADDKVCQLPFKNIKVKGLLLSISTQIHLNRKFLHTFVSFVLVF